MKTLDKVKWKIAQAKVPMPLDYEERERLFAFLKAKGGVDDPREALETVRRLWFAKMMRNTRERPFQPSVVLAVTKDVEETYEAFCGRMDVDNVPFVGENKRLLTLNIVVHDLNLLLRTHTFEESVRMLEVRA